jgi:hypothetical protein
MQFKSRYTGELVLSKGNIKTRRPIKQGEHVSFSSKTVERFGADIFALARKGLLAALDDEARAFAGQAPAQENDKSEGDDAPLSDEGE